MNNTLKSGLDKLVEYLHSKPLIIRFKGYDPFDGLNSPIISSTILGRSRLVRLIFVQFFKRSPINFRKLALIKPGYNPQALGLFLSSYAILYKHNNKQEYLANIEFLVDKIKETKLAGYSGACWGYNFSWQARAFYQPLNTPMIVPTTAVFNGLLDAYEVIKREELLELAISVRLFITKDLNRTYKGNFFAFSYSPKDDSVVYNASFMASSVLARIYHYTVDEQLLPLIDHSVKYCLEHQHEDGHWTYGEKPYHQWIDNFHTGYNLEALASISRYTNSTLYKEVIERGFSYYLSTFFTVNGKCRYYADKTYPIDINNPAQFLSTLVGLNKRKDNIDLANKVIEWTTAHMQNKKGYFYYRKHRYYTNKINYIRWSQSWMFYAMTKYLYSE